MEMLNPVIIDQADVDWEGWHDAGIAAESQIRWKLLIAGERTGSAGLVTGITEIPPGAQLALHHHDSGETYYIISGRGQIEIDGRTTEVGPGCAVYIPPEARHAFRCAGADTLVFIFSFPQDRFDQIVYRFGQ